MAADQTSQTEMHHHNLQQTQTTHEALIQVLTIPNLAIDTMAKFLQTNNLTEV